MANLDNQSQKFIYIRSLKEKVPCTEQQFQEFYREATRIRTQALDAARFFFGTAAADVALYPGRMNLTEFLDEDLFDEDMLLRCRTIPAMKVLSESST